MTDRIIIKDLRVRTRIGVGELERNRAQEVWISVEMSRPLQKPARTDSVRDTVDYDAVSKAVDKVASVRSRKLIERLAGDVGRELVKNFGVKTVKVSVKKFIVKRTRYVAVEVTTAKQEKRTSATR